jgi:hypothetical protein
MCQLKDHWHKLASAHYETAARLTRYIQSFETASRVPPSPPRPPPRLRLRLRLRLRPRLRLRVGPCAGGLGV